MSGGFDGERLHSGTMTHSSNKHVPFVKVVNGLYKRKSKL